jgi:hypothetical protein
VRELQQCSEGPQPSLARSTRRSCDQTLTRLVRELGNDRLSTLPVAAVTVAVTTAWGGRAPATWNRHVASVGSIVGFCRRRRWLTENLTTDLERRPEPAARASEALSINVEDLDLDNKRVRVRSKGGDTDWLPFQTGAARLLPRLIAGRTHGPLLLADRRPAPARAPATVDRCPQSGRGRLSYRRAEALFLEASGGWTLHRLRHWALTHLAGQNVSLPLLMEEPPRQPAVAAALCPPGCRGGGGDDRGHRPGAPTHPGLARVGVVRSLEWGSRRLMAEVDKA